VLFLLRLQFLLGVQKLGPKLFLVGEVPLLALAGLIPQVFIFLKVGLHVAHARRKLLLEGAQLRLQLGGGTLLLSVVPELLLQFSVLSLQGFKVRLP